MNETIAHISPDFRKQTVLEHCENVAELSAEFASVFNAEKHGYLTGMFHDIGKYSNEFQKHREFGFGGLIMTDWTTTEHGDDCTAAGCVRAGNDLVMPGQFSDHESIRRALADGTLSPEALRACITRIVRVILKSNRYAR